MDVQTTLKNYFNKDFLGPILNDVEVENPSQKPIAWCHIIKRTYWGDVAHWCQRIDELALDTKSEFGEICQTYDELTFSC